MIAAFGTLAFLATLWLLVVVGAAVLEESGAKIAAALKGKSVRQPSLLYAPARLRIRANVRRPMRAAARLRAAA
jgi:acyl dehydratase